MQIIKVTRVSDIPFLLTFMTYGPYLFRFVLGQQGKLMMTGQVCLTG